MAAQHRAGVAPAAGALDPIYTSNMVRHWPWARLSF
jgi:hypothetical protein